MLNNRDSDDYTRLKILVKEDGAYLYFYIVLGYSDWLKCEIITNPDI